MGSASQTPHDGPREILARLQSTILNDYDMDGQADLFASDGIVEWPFAPPGMPRRVEGREAIRDALVPLGEMARRADWRLRGYSSVVMHDTSDPNEIIVEFDVDVERGGGGQRCRLSYIQVLRVRSGEIVLFRDYYNPQALSALFESPSEDMTATLA